ncbi:MAG TPA: transcriptional regulator [Anaerolineales bacterium]|nr:transcriptional regulator [Anaerolineae bacterium]HIQ01460.1 transcriptional regulator [Anaerolineales bacterium]
MPDLNPLIHQPTRLRIMAALIGLNEGDKVDFGFLQDLLGLTAGNLSVHLQRLEAAGYVAVEKTFVGRRPKTWVWVTRKGRDEFAAHVGALERIIGEAGRGN